MKKFSLGILSLVCILAFGFSVLAAGGTVTAVSASATTTSATVSGTTSGVFAAVAVQVLDGSNNVLGMGSIVVMGDAFNGTIDGLTLTAGETYTVRVANYDGGTWKTTTVTATAPAEPPAEPPAATPPAADPADNNNAAEPAAATPAATEPVPQERIKDDVPKTGDPAWEVEK